MIAITGHFERPRVKRLAKRAQKILESCGAGCLLADIKKKKFNSSPVSLVVAVGGDGTLLRVVRELTGEKPVVGIAAGEQSALMQVKQREMEAKLSRIAGGKYRVQGRTRLHAIADGRRLPGALNEVMLVNRKSGAIIDYCLQVNGRRKHCCKADACIVATATGSTGHAYSAGGKRLPKASRKIAIVPSNPLNRHGKPLYVGGSSKIVVGKLNKARQHEVVLDGQPRFGVRKRIVVKRGRDALFVQF